MTLTTIRNRIIDAANKFDHLSGPQKELLDAILSQFEGTSHPKVITEDGNTMVWCNYHNQYEPAELFDTKETKSGNETYKASCRDGERERRKERAMKRKAEHAVTKALVRGLINADDATEMLRAVETGQYDEVIERINALKGDK